MALKDLLIHVDRTDGALVRLRLGADLARRHHSRLTALYVRELDPAQRHARSTGEFGLVSAADLNRDSDRAAQVADATAERLARELEAIRVTGGLEVELRSIEGSAASVVPQHARFADLCILSQQTRSTGASDGYTFGEEVLFSTGRPVLFVPVSGSFDSLGRHIVLAWNSSRASARALNDALPLMERAERVTVLAINPSQYTQRYGALAPEQIVAHIRHHTSNVELSRLESVARESIAATVQNEARRLGADLLVAGAFGHPKLWEQVVGGVTRDLLAQMTLPILMSY